MVRAKSLSFMRKAGGFLAPRGQEFQGYRRCADLFRDGLGAAAPILLENLAAGSGPRPWRSLRVVIEDPCGAGPFFPLMCNRAVEARRKA